VYKNYRFDLKFAYFSLSQLTKCGVCLNLIWVRHSIISSSLRGGWNIGEQRGDYSPQALDCTRNDAAGCTSHHSACSAECDKLRKLHRAEKKRPVNYKIRRQLFSFVLQIASLCERKSVTSRNFHFFMSNSSRMNAGCITHLYAFVCLFPEWWRYSRSTAAINIVRSFCQ